MATDGYLQSPQQAWNRLKCSCEREDCGVPSPYSSSPEWLLVRILRIPKKHYCKFDGNIFPLARECRSRSYGSVWLVGLRYSLVVAFQKIAAGDVAGHKDWIETLAWELDQSGYARFATVWAALDLSFMEDAVYPKNEQRRYHGRRLLLWSAVWRVVGEQNA